MLIWLIAEDEADILNLMSTMCMVWGHTPLTFETGQKVWDWLDKIEAGQAQLQMPDFVLMDIRMPGKKGNDVANRMRQISAFQHLPIALMTANSLSPSEQSALMERDGVDYIIAKPLPGFDELRQTIDEIIRKKIASKPS
ncbi:MAG: response regulator [Anaerolineae bacterium]|nr:response regulator [Anaerolineae bacterium]